MGAWLWNLWTAVWPNLAADLVALGSGFVWHHRRVQALLLEERQRLHDLLGEHHAKVTELLDPSGK